MIERYRHGVQHILASHIGLARPSRAFAVDAALSVAAGLLTAGFAAWLFSGLDFEVMCHTVDVWLDSDPARIIATLQSRFDIAHHRSNLHPLWGIGVTSFFIGLVELGGMSLPAMVTTYVAISGFAFGATMFVALRLLRLRRPDCFLSLGLCLSTSSAWLWFGVPELFILGAVSFVVPLIWLAAPRGRHDLWSGPLQSLVSVSITITNWVAGLFAALLALGLRGALMTAMIAFSLAGFLAVVQYRYFPESGPFFNIWTERWAVYGTPGTFLQHLRTFFLSTIAAPIPDLMMVDEDFRMETGYRLSRLQFTPPTDSPVGLAALALWAVIAGRGLWAAARGAVDQKVATFILAMIGFNLVLHAFYGIETILYSLHFLPFFTFVAAWSLLPVRGRMAMRVAIAAAIALGVVHNFALFETMADWFNALPAEAVAVDPEVVSPACTLPEASDAASLAGIPGNLAF